MGRWEVWSDPQVQELAKEFVCVADECWDLCPPDWFNRQWLKTIKSTELFEIFLEKAPQNLVPEGSSTCQGTYCMTAEGDYLAGGFAWVDRERTIAVLEQALQEFEKTGGEMKPVPQNKLPFFVGPEPPRGGLKIQLGYRDLPRGKERYPNTERNKRPVNLGFLDLKIEEVREFLPVGKDGKKLSELLVKKISQHALKDAARGQCNAEETLFEEGEWKVREIGRTEDRLLIELTGHSVLVGEGSRFEPVVFGRLEYEFTTKAFTKFDLVAVGQRSGASQFNFRGGDEDAAPLGVAFRLFAKGN